MTYSIIGIPASVILLITNQDILRKGRPLTRAQHTYRSFLVGVMAYYNEDVQRSMQAGLNDILILSIDFIILYMSFLIFRS